MDEVTLAKKSLQLIQKDFGLEDNIELEEVKNAFDWLENFLTDQVHYLIDHDLNRLLNALYRIDIPENKVRALLELSIPSEISRNIAKAIIEREKRKVLTRAQYPQH